ncbi:cytochrome c [Thiomonas sp. X19]|uniref:c-type cytochrome n=1 Tax=Thiomonas sp. X19 TaxID=1050370 RepID=UPI000DD909D9|nr:cytochrome c [Thiomonas sp. X19]
MILTAPVWLLFSIGVAVAQPILKSQAAQQKPLATAAVGDVARGQNWAPLCMSCHGAHGISTEQIYPNLAGQKETYLINAMHEYKNGMRLNPTMVAMASPLDSQVIADLAAFFSSLKPGN